VRFAETNGRIYSKEIPVTFGVFCHGDCDAMARQAMMSIFSDRDRSVVDRYFAEPFIQHDPNVGDGLAGLRTFAAEVAKSPTTNITIYRTVVDNDIVMLHSKYEGMPGFSGPVIAFDLFRFKNGKIIEHWGGQEAEADLNLIIDKVFAGRRPEAPNRLLANRAAHNSHQSQISLWRSIP
jgi:predicted SnoaL-like aldol condensation-catalyzing enzyme